MPSRLSKADKDKKLFELMFRQLFAYKQKIKYKCNFSEIF